MGKLRRGEVLLVCAACVCAALAAGVRAGSAATARIVPPVPVRTSAPAETAAAAPAETALKVNINTADADELALLPGIGETLSARIVAYREAHGPFSGAEALLEVPGIGEGRLRAIRDYITVGETP